MKRKLFCFIMVILFLLVILAVVLFNNQRVNCENDETILVDLNDLIQNSSNPTLTVYYTDDYLIYTRSPISAEALVYGTDCKHRFDLFELDEYKEHIMKFKETRYKCTSDSSCYMNARVHYVFEDSKTGKKTEITLGINDTVLVDGKFINLKEEPQAKSLYQFIAPFLLEGNAGRQITELYQ